MSEEQKWKCLSQKFFVLILDDLQFIPLSLSFNSTAQKVGLQLVNLLFRCSMDQKPIYARKYKLSSTFIDGKKGKFYLPEVMPAGWVNETQYNFAKQVFERIKDVTLETAEQETKEEPLALD